MKLIVSAANVHQGGGRTLLLSLLEAARVPMIVFVDARLVPPPKLPDNVELIVVEPTIAARVSAERTMASLGVPGDVLVAFGNLPPLFATPAKVYVYIQNRYLTSDCSLGGLPFRAQLRIQLERLWLRLCLRDATILVQTPSMVREVQTSLGRDAVLAPFGAANEQTRSKAPAEFDYVYVASGEPHKNHRKLVEAWELLAGEGIYPTLRLTLDPSRERELCLWLNERTQRHALRITIGQFAAEEMMSAYASASALIYPSLFESFGLPLIEASQAGLPILASERDYVRDVVAPRETFDPESAVSIARAIKRHMRLNLEVSALPSAEDFLARIVGSS